MNRLDIADAEVNKRHMSKGLGMQRPQGLLANLTGLTFRLEVLVLGQKEGEGGYWWRLRHFRDSQDL